MKENVVGKAELDQAQSDVDSLKARIAYAQQQIGVAESQVELQQTNLADMVVRAPFSGVAISKDAQPGEMISPVSAGGGFTRTGICTIVDMSSLEIEVDVNESYINRVQAGSEGRGGARRVSRLADSRRTSSRRFRRRIARRRRCKVRIGFEQLDPRILPDMGVKVTFLRDEPARPARPPSRAARRCVPKAAVRTLDGTVGRVRGATTIASSAARSRVGARERRSDRSAVRRLRRASAWSSKAPPIAEGRRQGEGACDVRDSLVTVRDLHKVFHRGGERIDVLQGVNLDIPQGDFLALMGPSGSGKTTLLNLIGGLDTPTEGSIAVAGDRIDKMSGGKLSQWRARHIGFVFQLYNLLPVLTAARNVELPLLLTKLSKAERRKRVQVALSVVGLADRMNHYPRQLSGGQEQRVGIARAIVTDPTLLLCDEPTGDLDRKAGDEILDLLQALNREHGKTIVMVTHDPHAAARAKRTLHLDKGVLVSKGRRSHEVPSAGLAQPAAAEGPDDLHARCRSSSPSCCSAC